MNKASISPSAQSQNYWCHACRKVHDGAPAGLIGETLQLCQSGVDHYERLGVLQRERDGQPPEYRLVPHPTKPR
jgi:hypothetical protein